MRSVQSKHSKTPQEESPIPPHSGQISCSCTLGPFPAYPGKYMGTIKFWLVRGVSSRQLRKGRTKKVCTFRNQKKTLLWLRNGQTKKGSHISKPQEGKRFALSREAKVQTYVCESNGDKNKPNTKKVAMRKPVKSPNFLSHKLSSVHALADLCVRTTKQTTPRQHARGRKAFCIASQVRTYILGSSALTYTRTTNTKKARTCNAYFDHKLTYRSSVHQRQRRSLA